MNQTSVSGTQSAVERALQHGVSSNWAPGVVAALTNARGLIVSSAAGAARTSPFAPMGADTVFRAASMTKLVTTVAVLMLYEQGKLDLDDALAKHLPGFDQPKVLVSFDHATDSFTVRESGSPVTIRHLLTHTSGFGYWFLDPEILHEAKGRVDFFDAPFLMHEPGARFSYGIGVDIAGLLIEPLSGMTLERFFAERITGPLGMRATSFDLPLDSSSLASLHERSGSSWSEIPLEQTAEPPRGGGGLYTTAADYLALLRLLLNDGTADDGTRLLSERSVAAMTTNQIGELRAERQMTAYRPRACDFEFMDGSQKFGLGALIETRDHPDGRSRGSYGWGGIFNTFFWVDPTAGIGAVLMMQVKPFCDPGCMSLYRDFERSVYRSLPSRRGARPETRH